MHCMYSKPRNDDDLVWFGYVRQRPTLRSEFWLSSGCLAERGRGRPKKSLLETTRKAFAFTDLMKDMDPNRAQFHNRAHVVGKEAKRLSLLLLFLYKMYIGILMRLLFSILVLLLAFYCLYYLAIICYLILFFFPL